MKKFGTGSANGSSPHYLRRRASELRTKTSRALTDPLADWSCRRIRLEGRPFSFEGHEYLRAIYDDTSPHVVLMKAAQIGGTTWAILRSLHACISGLNVVYYFPTKTDVHDFSRSRVSPLVEDNPFLARLMADTNAVGLKRVADGFLYLRGMQSTVGLKSVPADMVVFDELDEATPEAKTMARERLSHSPYGRIIELSNPSLPGFGIDEAYQASDQRHWTIRCGCGYWVALDREFPTTVGQEVTIIRQGPDGHHYRACPRCDAELDLAAGQWVPEFPGRSVHGYRISQLISPAVDPGSILHEYQITRYPDSFYNLKIGIAWADVQRRVDASTVLALCTDKPMLTKADGYCTMGVDTGRALHVVILQQEDADPAADRHSVVYLSICREFSQLDDLMRRFHVDRCVIDGLPETHATRQFAKRHRGKVFLCFFNENQRGEPNWNNNQDYKVDLNRTEALDASRAAIRDRMVTLPRRDALVEQFAHHMAADAKKLEEDQETGAQKYRYIKTGENHFSFAFTYAWLASQDVTGFRMWMRYFREEFRRQGQPWPLPRTPR